MSLKCAPQEARDAVSGAITESSRKVYMGLLYRFDTGFSHSVGGRMECMERPQKRPRFGAISPLPPCTKPPLSASDTSGETVQAKVRQGWHQEPRSVAWISHGEPGPCLVLPWFPSWHAEEPPASPGCHAGLSPASAWVFLSSLGPFVLGSSGRAANCICRKSRSSQAAVSKMDVGLSQRSSGDPGRQYPGNAKLQLFAKAS